MLLMAQHDTRNQNRDNILEIDKTYGATRVYLEQSFFQIQQTGFLFLKHAFSDGRCLVRHGYGGPAGCLLA